MPYSSIMKRDYKARSGITLGGIGTGGMELRKDGLFYNWSIFNNPPLGLGEKLQFNEDSILFFVVRYQEKGKDPQMKVLQVEEGYEVGAIKAHSHYYIFPWLTGVDEIEYSTTFPTVKMKFSDGDMPFDIYMEAFTPFIPHDIKNSSLPGSIFNFEIKSKTENQVDVMLMASMRNGVGYDVEDKVYKTTIQEGEEFKLFEMTCEGMDKTHSSYGTQSIASLSEDSTYYVGWEHVHPYYQIVLDSKKLPNIDDTAGRNVSNHVPGGIRASGRLFSTIAVSRKLKDHSSFKHSFVATWDFPNLYARNNGENGKEAIVSNIVEGKYYSNFFNSAAEVALYIKDNKATLQNKTYSFIKNFYDSSIPEFALDQINSHLNTIVNNSWLTKAGDFGLEEGREEGILGILNTVDVSMYGIVMVDALYPELAKSMMRGHRLKQLEDGQISHSIDRGFKNIAYQNPVTFRMDLCIQYSIMTLKTYFLTSDIEYLMEMWESVKKALNYINLHKDANSDGLPDMAGIMCSYDNFPMYGAASYIGSQWLSALSYAVKAAEVLKDEAALHKYKQIFETGKVSFENKLWNGEYYRLYNDEGGIKGDINEGCLTDQLIGQWANNFTNAGYIVNKDRVRTALGSIYNKAYNPIYGLVNCRWPEDGFLHPIDKDIWIDQANTCWTGVELEFAAFLIYEGMTKEGLEIIYNVDTRYRKSGMYYDHQECGGHYYRPMSAWAIINAFLGLSISEDKYIFAPKIKNDEAKLFFSFNGGTGHYTHNLKNKEMALTVHSGILKAKRIEFQYDFGSIAAVSLYLENKNYPVNKYNIKKSENNISIEFTEDIFINEGSKLVVKIL